MKLQRRNFLGLALGVAGGSIYSRPLAAMLNDTSNATLMIDWPPYASKAASAFSPTQRALFEAITETILPRTDTPGAKDAGVGNFIELIFAEWMTDKERAIFIAGADEVESRTNAKTGTSFVLSNAATQKSILEEMEAAVQSDPWYELGSPAAHETGAPFIAQLKELTVVGFFTSEVGATEVLRHNHFPGYFEGDIPLEPGESSWTPGPLV